MISISAKVASVSSVMKILVSPIIESVQRLNHQDSLAVDIVD